MMRGSRRQDLLYLAFLFVAGAIWCQGLLRGQFGIGPEALLDGDALYGSGPVSVRAFDDWTPTVLELPRDRHIVERARAGHLDLWNPLQGTGVPLPPDQGGLFSPLRLVHLIAPGVGGYALFHCIRLWIAAVGAFFFARSRGLSRPGATIAGVVFGFGGGMVGQLPFISAGPVCFLPWVLLAQAELLRRPSAWARVIFGLTVALTLTAGHPTLAAVVLIGAVVHGLASLWSVGDRRGRLIDLALGWAFGMAFAAPYLFTFVEYVANGFSYKHTGLGLRNHGVWREFARACFGPSLAGPSLLDAVRDRAGNGPYPYILNFVAGTAAWVLACAGALRRRVPRDLYVLAAAGILLSLEPPPLDGVVYVPLLRDILSRYYWPLVMLPVGCAAGAGADAIASADREGTWRELRGLAPAVAVFAALALAALGISLLDGGRMPTPWIKLAAALPSWLPRLAGYHLAAIAGLVVAAVAARFAVRRRAAGLLLLVTADLAFLMVPHLRERPAAAIRRPLSADVQRLAAEVTAAHGRITGTTKSTVMAPLSSLAGMADIRMTAPLVPARYDAFLHAAGAGDAFTFFVLPSVRSAWADLAAVRLIVADDAKRETLKSDRSLQQAAALPTASVFDNPAAFERARLFFGAAVAKDRDDAAARLRMLGRGGDHIGATSLGDRVILEPAGKVAPAPLAGNGSAPARWIRDEADEIILETEGASAGYLMLADTYYPGWWATVDGVRAPIFPADVGFRAVPVPAGKHTVRFVYRPVSMWSGVGVVAAAVVAAGIMVRRERRRAASAA